MCIDSRTMSAMLEAWRWETHGGKNNDMLAKGGDEWVAKMATTPSAYHTFQNHMILSPGYCTWLILW